MYVHILSSLNETVSIKSLHDMVYVKNNVILSAMKEFKFIALGIQFQIKIHWCNGSHFYHNWVETIKTAFLAISLTIEAN